MFKLVNAIASQKDGESTVTLKYKNKEFTGFANLHPDDEWSDFFGCEIAEIRAKIYAAKWELQNRRQELKNCQNFIKAVECYADFNPESPTARAMYRQLNQRKKAVAIAKERVASLQASIPIMIKNRELFQTKVAMVKKKRESGQI